MGFAFQEVPLHWVNRLGFVVRKELGRRFEAAGHRVSAEEWAVLVLLWRADGQTPGALAEATIRDRTTVTRLVDGMANKKFVVRKTDGDDRRRSLVCLSQKGQSLQDVLVPIAKTMIAECCEGLSAREIKQTVSTLRTMTNNLLAVAG